MASLASIGRALVGMPAPELLDAAATSPLAAASYQLPAVQGDVAQVSDLPPEVAAAFGINTDTDTITRKQAMKVPAFARGRNQICGTVGILGLGAVRLEDDGRRTPVRSLLLDQPDPNTTRQWVLTWTVDDLLCHGIAWWHVTARGADDRPVAVERVTVDRVGIDPTSGTVTLDGRPVPDRDLIRFDGWHEGALRFGAEALVAALLLERAVKRYANNPQPTAVLYDKRPIEQDAPELDPDSVDALLERWRTGGLSERAVRWLNRATGVEFPDWNPQQLDLTAARDQSATQVARLLNLPSRAVNAPAESGMTYSNVSAERTETLATVEPYLVAIEQRLSLDDVTAHGQAVLIDRDTYTLGTAAERVELATKAAGNKPVMTVTESRSRFLGLPPAGPELAQPRPTGPAPDDQEDDA